MLAWTLATVLRPRDLASCQCRVARGPGPTAEMEYSPTVVLTPPRSSGRDHSLTDWSQVRGRLGRAAMVSAADASGQPQSQAMTLALGAAAWTAASTVALTSARMAAAVRSLHRGQAL